VALRGRLIASADKRPVTTPPSATGETPNEFWNRLLAESRGRRSVSKVTLLVPPARRGYGRSPDRIP
jgi:hypothetical protein